MWTLGITMLAISTSEGPPDGVAVTKNRAAKLATKEVDFRIPRLWKKTTLSRPPPQLCGMLEAMNNLEEQIIEAVEATWAAYGSRWWNALDADDAKQQAFMACWERKDRYNPELSAPATFFSMVARQAITVLRQKHSSNRETVSLSGEIVEDGPSHADLIPAREENVAETRDEVALVKGAARELLTKAELETLESVTQGAIPKEMAAAQGVSPQAVSKRLNKGLSKLRSALSKAQ